MQQEKNERVDWVFFKKKNMLYIKTIYTQILRIDKKNITYS